MTKLKLAFLLLVTLFGTTASGLLYSQDAYALHGCPGAQQTLRVVRIGLPNPQVPNMSQYPVECAVSTCQVPGVNNNRVVMQGMPGGGYIVGATYRPFAGNLPTVDCHARIDMTFIINPTF